MAISTSASIKAATAADFSIPKVKASGANSTNSFATVMASQASTKAQTPAAGQSPGGTSADGLTVAGKFYTNQQIKDFYAAGGNDYTFAQANGLRDQNFIHDLALQARAIGGAPTGDAAVQLMFKQYQSSTPNGADANNFAAWKADQAPALLEKVRNGTYVGQAIDTKDFNPGGIFAGQNACYRQNGLDANGMSDKWVPGVGFAESAPPPVTS